MSINTSAWFKLYVSAGACQKVLVEVFLKSFYMKLSDSMLQWILDCKLNVVLVSKQEYTRNSDKHKGRLPEKPHAAYHCWLPCKKKSIKKWTYLWNSA